MFSELKVTSSTQICSDFLDSSFPTDLTWIGAEGSREPSNGTKHAIAASVRAKVPVELAPASMVHTIELEGARCFYGSVGLRPLG